MHLFLLFRLSNGACIKIEKNHVIEAYIANWDMKDVESIEVGTNGKSFNEFLLRGVESVGPERYFVYDSKVANCQYFVNWNLSANGLWNSSVEQFTMQDAVSIYKNLGLLEKANKAITNIAGRGDHILHGSGIRKRRMKTV